MPIVFRVVPLAALVALLALADSASAQGLCTNMGPPPGTLGQTYTRFSRPVSIDEHPRAAKIEIRNASHYRVIISGPQKFKGDLDDDGVWRFESDRPLVPGTAQIYKIRGAPKPAMGVPPTPPGPFPDNDPALFVRMIPGRIIYISF